MERARIAVGVRKGSTAPAPVRATQPGILAVKTQGVGVVAGGQIRRGVQLPKTKRRRTAG
jgi:hypothetical protein